MTSRSPASHTSMPAKPSNARVGAALLVAALLGSAGCSLAPKYQRPAAPVAESYPEATGPISPAVELSWQQFFGGDARLRAIIALALENNRDLHAAALNVERVRALYRIQRAATFPDIAATGDGTRRQTPASLSPTGERSIDSTYQVGLSIPAYELDFFGRVASLRDTALQQYLATEQAHRSAHIALISAVARQYLNLLATEERLDLAQQILAAAERSYALNHQSFEAGIASEIDLRTAEAQREAVRASVAEIEQARDLAYNALVLLVGAPLPATLPAAGTLASQEALIEDLPAGLPSELLTRRPDILAAEHNLRAANANIGAARAAFFPSVRLTAFGGSASPELSDLFEGGTKAWTFAPSIALPIFAGGRNRAQLDVAKLAQRIEITNYEKAIQTAFREVADALAVAKTIGTQVDAQAARVTAATRRYELSQARYRAGVDSYLAVLLAQQELFTAQQQLVAARLARLSNLTGLYAALGGGWDDSSETPAQTAARLSAAR
ncbi:efflux transporter outer membrane subunit [Cephaloticoccus primus]|nr:efflux transporter outer membrane subunit [Cephaloticoccus primus]